MQQHSPLCPFAVLAVVLHRGMPRSLSHQLFAFGWPMRRNGSSIDQIGPRNGGFILSYSSVFILRDPWRKFRALFTAFLTVLGCILMASPSPASLFKLCPICHVSFIVETIRSTPVQRWYEVRSVALASFSAGSINRRITSKQVWLRHTETRCGVYFVVFCCGVLFCRMA